MSEVQVGFGTIIRDITLAVFVRVEGARVDVDVGVQLLDGDLHPTRLQELGQRGTDDALTQTGGDASGDENIFGGLGLSRNLHTGY